MNRKRYKAAVVLFCIAVNLACIAYGGHGAVLCVAHDHVAIEPAVAKGCCVEPGAPNHADAPAFLSRSGTPPSGNPANCDCGPCRDIPLLSEFLASSSPSSRTPASKPFAVNATSSSSHARLACLLSGPLASGSVPTYSSSKLSGISVLRI